MIKIKIEKSFLIALSVVVCSAFFFVFYTPISQATEQISSYHTQTTGDALYYSDGWRKIVHTWFNNYDNITKLKLPLNGTYNATTSLTICEGTPPAILGDMCADQATGRAYINANADNCFNQGGFTYFENIYIASSTYTTINGIYYFPLELDHAVQLRPDRYYYYVITLDATNFNGHFIDSTGLWDGLTHPCDPTWSASYYIFYDDEYEPYFDPETDIVDINGEYVGTTTATTSIALFTRDICVGIATSTVIGAVECALKQAIAWAFYPSETALGWVASSTEKLKDAFPFSTFFEITDTITTAIATTSTSTTETIKIPMITATGTFYMLPVLSSSSLPNLIGSTNTATFRTTLVYIVWVVLALLILSFFIL